MAEGEVMCHDGTPFVNYQCPVCDFLMHVHKSELPDDYQEIEMRSFCERCGSELVLPLPEKFIGEE